MRACGRERETYRERREIHGEWVALLRTEINKIRDIRVENTRDHLKHLKLGSIISNFPSRNSQDRQVLPLSCFGHLNKYLQSHFQYVNDEDDSNHRVCCRGVRWRLQGVAGRWGRQWSTPRKLETKRRIVM